MVTKFVGECEEQGYVKPSAYQGFYKTLFPLLRQYGITFHAYRFVHSPTD